MNFKIHTNEDELVSQMFDESMKELNAFYGINWVRNIPRLIVVSDRKTIDALRSQKTEPWVVGWVDRGNVYVIDRNTMNAESSHIYKPETYRALIQHELSHAFFLVVSKGNNKPKWFWEGVAVFTSGQNKFNIKPSKLERFLSHYEDKGFCEYAESGFAIESISQRFGDEKLLELIKASCGCNTKEGFDELFQKVYGSKPTYNFFNKKV